MKERLINSRPESNISTLTDQFYERAKTFNNSASWVTDSILLKNLAQMVEKPAGTKGIELCCGTGVVSQELSKLGLNMTGIDITPAMLRESAKHMKVTQGNVENLPFDDNSADFIIIRQALFLTESAKTLDSVRRVLKPGGQFIVCNTVPISDDCDADYLKEIHLTKQKDLKQFYTASSLKEELTDHGFIICKAKFLTVRESIDHWMNPRFAPELSLEKRQEVLDMIQFSPREYQKVRDLKIINGQTSENWGWQIYSTTIDKVNQRTNI